MIRTFRVAGGLVMSLFGLVLGFSLYVLMQSSTYESSLEHQKALHSDFKRIGHFVEKVRLQTGSLPSNDSVQKWVRAQHMTSRLIAENISIVPTNDTCVVGEETMLPDDGHTYRICYWDNWTEEYAPQTGAHTFALSAEDFKPRWWEIFLFAVFSIGAMFISFRLLRFSDNKEMHPA